MSKVKYSVTPTTGEITAIQIQFALGENYEKLKREGKGKYFVITFSNKIFLLWTSITREIFEFTPTGYK